MRVPHFPYRFADNSGRQDIFRVVLPVGGGRVDPHQPELGDVELTVLLEGKLDLHVRSHRTGGGEGPAADRMLRAQVARRIVGRGWRAVLHGVAEELLLCCATAQEGTGEDSREPGRKTKGTGHDVHEGVCV